MRALCERFHQEATGSSSGLLFQRVGRSPAAAELKRAGKAALPFIIEHLERHKGEVEFDYSDMRGVWSFLLNEMKQDLDPTGPSIPFQETDRWIAWAKKIAA